ncbi:MAG: ribonuclease III [Lentisphaerae bacterium]|nr:ribonuclease III [Lentisphaerota bacterium]
MPIGRKNPYKVLERALGYRFRKRELLERALMHRSYRFENPEITNDNQRLEFLGDAVLGFVTAAYLFDQHEDRDEGFLTALRSQTTSGKALAEIAGRIAMGEYLKIGKGEHKSGGRQRASNLADALEAVLGAAYLDGGVKAIEKIFKRVFVPEIDNLSGNVWDGNPKGELQEYAQRRWKKSPQYRVARREGSAHNGTFVVEVHLPEKHRITGRGPNKQDAEANAAANALKRLKRNKSSSRRRSRRRRRTT